MAMASNSFLNQGQEEDIGEGQLPKEFEDARPLLLGEVSEMLEKRAEEHEQMYDDGLGLSDMFQKAKEYSERFSKLKSSTVIHHVWMMLLKKEEVLTPYEMAVIGNLCPHSVEEAKSLLPSLEGKIDDDELLELLDDIQTTVKYQSE